MLSSDRFTVIAFQCSASLTVLYHSDNGFYVVHAVGHNKVHITLEGEVCVVMLSKLHLLTLSCSAVSLLAGCGTYEQPIQPSRYQIENVDRNSGDNEDLQFPVDPSINYDDESINPDIPQKNTP